MTGTDALPRLVIPGLVNLRDLGGTPTAHGRTVQHRRLWRSENQTGLPASSLQALIEQGLTDVVDLRTDFERAGSPSPLRSLPRVRYHHHSFSGRPRTTARRSSTAPCRGWAIRSRS